MLAEAPLTRTVRAVTEHEGLGGNRAVFSSTHRSGGGGVGGRSSTTDHSRSDRDRGRAIERSPDTSTRSSGGGAGGRSSNKDHSRATRDRNRDRGRTKERSPDTSTRSGGGGARGRSIHIPEEVQIQAQAIRRGLSSATLLPTEPNPSVSSKAPAPKREDPRSI